MCCIYHAVKRGAAALTGRSRALISLAFRRTVMSLQTDGRRTAAVVVVGGGGQREEKEANSPHLWSVLGDVYAQRTLDGTSETSPGFA